MDENQPVWGEYEIEVKIVTDPADRRRVLLQLPFGYILPDADEAQLLGEYLIEAAKKLREEQASGN